MELVSVVIATCKRKKELARALDSIFNQSYQKMEIIVINDNGKMEYSAYVEELIEKYRGSLTKYKNICDLICIHNETNKGAVFSRNTGIKNASGKYVAFLDDDDTWLPEKIEKQIHHFENSEFKNLGIVYCHTKVVDANGDCVALHQNTVRGDYLYQSMLTTIAATSQFVCLKEALLKVRGFRNVPSKEDTILPYDLALAGYRIDCVPEILSYYHETDIERISGDHERTLRGELVLREILRKEYGRLGKEQKKMVEYHITFRIYYLQIRSGRYKDADKSLMILLKNHIGLFAIFMLLIKHPFRRLLGNR